VSSAQWSAAPHHTAPLCGCGRGRGWMDQSRTAPPGLCPGGGLCPGNVLVDGVLFLTKKAVRCPSGLKCLTKKTFINITFAGDFADIFHRVADLNL
jgi:hypothetical protein